MRFPVFSSLLLPILAGSLLSISAIQAPTPPKSYVIGDVVDNFTLKNVDGRWISLDSYSNANGYIIVFTCNHCPYARNYEQRIINLHKKFAPQGFPVIAINPNSPLIAKEDSYEEMQLRAKEKKYPFVYLFDEQQTVYPKFGATRTPHVFILDKDRRLRYIGAIDNCVESPDCVTQFFAEDAVNALLRGEKPNPDVTRLVGCTIKKAPPAPEPVPTAGPVVEGH